VLALWAQRWKVNVGVDFRDECDYYLQGRQVEIGFPVVIVVFWLRF
jgi:hypothetical protein